MKEKHQTPAQRVANPVWLRAEIRKLVDDCDDSIAEEQALADKEHDEVRRARYLERVAMDQHWKRQLERILNGKTALEEFQEMLARQETCS